MKTFKYILKVITVIFAIIGIILSFLYIQFLGNIIYHSTGKADTEYEDVTNDKELATTENPVLSPSGKYWLQVVKGYDGEIHFNQFYIVKAGQNGHRTDKIVYFSEDTIRTRDRHFFVWDKDDRVWVYSGDVGTSVWQKTGEDIWQKYLPKDLNIQQPDKLNKLINSK